MKTSTKNIIIGGIFTISAAIIGTVSFSIGKEKQDNKIETTINQSGIITMNQSENSIDTIERLLDEYISLQTDFNDMSIKYSELKNDYDNISSYYANANSLIVSLEETNQNLQNQISELEIKNNELSNGNYTKENDVSETSEPFIEVIELTSLIDVGTYNDIEVLSEAHSVDSYGNSYKTGYMINYIWQYEGSYIAKYRLNGEYNKFMGSIAYCMDAYKDGYFILNFYDENDTLLYRTDKSDYNTEYFEFEFPIEGVEIIKISYEGNNLSLSSPRVIIPYLRVAK